MQVSDPPTGDSTGEGQPFRPNQYSGFVFKAELDWIEVRVRLAGPSQPRHLRSRMPDRWGLPFVQAETEESSYTSDTFVFRVQDPAGPAQFMREVAAIGRPGDRPIVESDIEILGAEVTFDAYHRDLSALCGMVENMLWRQAIWASHPRISSPLGGHGLATRTSAPRAVREGWSFNSGDIGDEFQQRWYLKQHDTRPGGQAYAPLTPSEHRARSEVTLCGERVPFSTIDGWRAFRFESLRRVYFAWRLPRGSEPAPLSWLREFPALGRREGAERTRKDRRKTSPDTRPDDELNRHALRALERLTRHQRRS